MKLTFFCDLSNHTSDSVCASVHSAKSSVHLFGSEPPDTAPPFTASSHPATQSSIDSEMPCWRAVVGEEHDAARPWPDIRRGKAERCNAYCVAATVAPRYRNLHKCSPQRVLPMQLCRRVRLWTTFPPISPPDVREVSCKHKPCSVT